MAGRPGKDSPARLDPNTGRPLPEGIRWRADRKRYQVRVQVQDFDGTWRERNPTFRTLAEAKREQAKIIAGKNPNGSMTLAEWYEQYWSVIEESVRAATARCCDVGWRLRVKPTLGNLRLDAITSPMIESVMVKWPGDPSVKVDALAVLSRLLDAAKRARYIDYNPAREIRRPTPEDGGATPTSRALTVEQVGQMLALMPEGVYANYAAALVYTGMRSGEATATRVRDADLDRDVLRVRRSLSPGKHGELIEQTPKSHKERDVPITQALRPYVVAAAAGKQPDDLLFSGPAGGRLTGANFRRAVEWPKVRAALGRSDLRVHDLRHTFATILFDGGASAPDVQATLGHSSLQVTERYSRAREGIAKRAGAVLDTLFNGPEMAQAHPTEGGSGADTREKPS